MGSQDFAGWVLIASGVLNAGGAVPVLVRARRSQGRSGAIPAGAWSGLLVGLGFFVSGVLYLSFPGDPHGTWLNWVPGALAAAALALMIVARIVSYRSRARRLGPGSADPPVLSSAHSPRPGPAIAPDARTAGLIERIKHVRFSTTRLGRGYDEEEVDVFLDKLVAALSGDGQLDRSELRGVRFSTTRLRPGYAMPDVDTFLGEVTHATW
jgi:DivIVA domain-containing protein